ncbi:alpha/beta hydrolase [Aurantibacillus circumpalustris]|uniref:alpha/beta hydrolase n=1 Tax=Aurantibacillus circumpalustris TaxID=3036359 RepID=UPI00295B07CF|nr:alpha/beta fold hydrolase [Aurantibacillus circumpalustris]
MLQLKNILIDGSKEKPILLDCFYTSTEKPKAVVIFAHGFKGFKDWGHFDHMANTFTEGGFVFIKFNFSHNGTTPEDPLNFGDLEAFGNNNFTIELDDCKNVIDWTLSFDGLKKEIDPERVYLLGHSRGGGIVILKAGEDKRVKKIATWAAVSDLVNRNKLRTIETWKKDGVVFAKNARTKQDMPLYYQFYENQQANKERLNINHAVKRLEIPFLIVHGTNDQAVKFKDAEDLYRSAKHAQLLVIENGDHTFGVKHPFNGTLPEHAKEVFDKTIDFFKK